MPDLHFEFGSFRMAFEKIAVCILNLRRTVVLDTMISGELVHGEDVRKVPVNVHKPTFSQR